MILNLHSPNFLNFPVPAPLQDMSWTDIAEVVTLGLAPSYWSVGDSKTDGTRTCTIVAFGDTSVTFSLGNCGTGSIASTASWSSGFVTPASSEWTDCRYYLNLIPTVRSGLSSDLRAVIKTVPKSYTDKSSGHTVTGNFDLWTAGYNEVSSFTLTWPSGLCWLRDCAEYANMTGSATNVYTYSKFYAMNDGVRTSDGYRDQWTATPAHPAGRSGTTNGKIVLFFTI